MIKKKYYFSKTVHSYREENVTSSQPQCYANLSISSQVLCCKPYISIYLGRNMENFDFL